MPTPPSEKVSLTFEEISQRLRAFTFPEVDAIVGIREGGIVPASLIAHQLALPLRFLSINYRDAENNPQRDTPLLLAEPTELPPKGSRVLLVDDVVVTGQTFKKACTCLADHAVTTFALKGKADLVLFPEVSRCVNWPWG